MKNDILFFFIFVFLTTICQAQGNMYIIQKSGETLVVPISNIDSITHHATLPIISTIDVSDISYASATSGGFIKSNGGAPVTARGVCWSTTPNPTISDDKAEGGSGNGSFTFSLTKLSPNTTYYVRSFATNSVGTAYGVEKSFKCLSEYLSSLSFKSGESILPLSPAFSKTTYAYTAYVDNEINSLTFTPIAENANSTITVNGVSVSSGATLPVNLSVGPNAIAVTVYNNGIVQQVYEINVTRMGDSRLSSLIIMSGSTNIIYEPEFDSGINDYSATVDYDVDNVTITPTSVSSTSTITVSPDRLEPFIMTSGTAVPIPLELGGNMISFNVEDYGDGRGYFVHIKRRRSSYLKDVKIIFDQNTLKTMPLEPAFVKNNQEYTVSFGDPDGDRCHVEASLEDPYADMIIHFNGKEVYNSLYPNKNSLIKPPLPDNLYIDWQQNTLSITVIPPDDGPERVYNFNIINQ
jgi:hypothetical protein